TSLTHAPVAAAGTARGLLEKPASGADDPAPIPIGDPRPYRATGDCSQPLRPSNKSHATDGAAVVARASTLYPAMRLYWSDSARNSSWLMKSSGLPNGRPPVSSSTLMLITSGGPVR